jgi:hypothetical protein
MLLHHIAKAPKNMCRGQRRFPVWHVLYLQQTPHENHAALPENLQATEGLQALVAWSLMHLFLLQKFQKALAVAWRFVEVTALPAWPQAFQAASEHPLGHPEDLVHRALEGKACQIAA